MQEHLMTDQADQIGPGETGSNTVDYRIPGIPLSTVEQQDTHRKDKVQKLIEKFENHPNKESSLQDFKQKRNRRGELRSKGEGKKSIHFNGSHENIELLLRTVISANQLSIYGAIADLCDEAPKRIRTLERWKSLPSSLWQKFLPRNGSGETYGKSASKLSEDLKSPKLCSDAGLKFVEREQYFYTLETEEGQRMQHLCREYTPLRNEEGDPCERMDSKQDKKRSSVERNRLLS